MLTLDVGRDFDAWKTQVRNLLERRVPPEDVVWREATDSQLLLLPDAEPAARPSGNGTIRVPREFVEFAENVFYHRSPARFGVLYRLLWRLAHGERNLLKIDVDDDVREGRTLRQQVGKDAHRMCGFVRFEKVVDAEGEFFLAWYRPDHRVVPLVAGNFVHRFRAQRWSILTPDDSAHWDMRKLRLGPGVATRPTTNDQLVSLWQTYYRSTYNPQRDNPKLFRQFVPTRFMRDLPEAKAFDEVG